MSKTNLLKLLVYLWETLLVLLIVTYSVRRPFTDVHYSIAGRHISAQVVNRHLINLKLRKFNGLTDWLLFRELLPLLSCAARGNLIIIFLEHALKLFILVKIRNCLIMLLHFNYLFFLNIQEGLSCLFIYDIYLGLVVEVSWLKLVIDNWLQLLLKFLNVLEYSPLWLRGLYPFYIFTYYYSEWRQWIRTIWSSAEDAPPFWSLRVRILSVVLCWDLICLR